MVVGGGVRLPCANFAIGQLAIRQSCPCHYQGSMRHPHLTRGSLMVDVGPGRVASELVSQPHDGELSPHHRRGKVP